MKLMEHFDVSPDSDLSRQPTLKLNINIAPGITETMVMFEGDTA
jgi:hypothetical protein